MRNVSRRAFLRTAPVMVGAAAAPIAALAAEPAEAVEYHVAKLVEALNKVNPGAWAVDICPKKRFVLIHRRS